MKCVSPSRCSIAPGQSFLMIRVWIVLRRLSSMSSTPKAWWSARKPRHLRWAPPQDMSRPCSSGFRAFDWLKFSITCILPFSEIMVLLLRKPYPAGRRCIPFCLKRGLGTHKNLNTVRLPWRSCFRVCWTFMRSARWSLRLLQVTASGFGSKCATGETHVIALPRIQPVVTRLPRRPLLLNTSVPSTTNVNCL